MLNELKILVENIKHFRLLLTEGVSDKTLIDAINERKYLYIYYEGETTVETGYRTIRPFVLGTYKKTGELVLRAFQDKGRSDSLRPENRTLTKPREKHEKVTWNGEVKPGWRLFKVNNIKEAYPTGIRFVDDQGNVEIPPYYHEQDRDMSGIVASVPQGGEATPVSGATKQKVPKWEKFKTGNPKNRRLTKNDILGLADIAKKVYKKPINRFFVAIDNRNYYYLEDKNVKAKFPQNAIVGDMDVLYNKFIKPTPSDPEKKRFYDQELNNLKQNTENDNLNQPEINNMKNSGIK